MDWELTTEADLYQQQATGFHSTHLPATLEGEVLPLTFKNISLPSLLLGQAIKHKRSGPPAIMSDSSFTSGPEVIQYIMTSLEAANIPVDGVEVFHTTRENQPIYKTKDSRIEASLVNITMQCSTNITAKVISAIRHRHFCAKITSVVRIEGSEPFFAQGLVTISFPQVWFSSTHFQTILALSDHFCSSLQVRESIPPPTLEELRKNPNAVAVRYQIQDVTPALGHYATSPGTKLETVISLWTCAAARKLFWIPTKMQPPPQQPAGSSWRQDMAQEVDDEEGDERSFRAWQE